MGLLGTTLGGAAGYGLAKVAGAGFIGTGISTVAGAVLAGNMTKESSRNDALNKGISKVLPALAGVATGFLAYNAVKETGHPVLGIFAGLAAGIAAKKLTEKLPKAADGIRSALKSNDVTGTIYNKLTDNQLTNTLGVLGQKANMLEANTVGQLLSL